MSKPSIVVDFDTCVFDYTLHGWEDIETLEGEPIENSKEALGQLSEIYNIKLYSNRFMQKRGKKVVIEWLNEYDIPYDELVYSIPPHLTYISRKVTKFDRRWDDDFIKDLESMNPKM